MAKTEEELRILKEKVNELREALSELNEEELRQVVGGTDFDKLGWDRDWDEDGCFRSDSTEKQNSKVWMGFLPEQ